MKKKILLFLMSLLLLPAVAQAQEFVVDDIMYRIFDYENNCVEVGGYEGKPKEVIFPSSVTFNGTEYKVTAIYSSAYRDCSSLTSVIFPEGLTTIGEYAFCNCPSLTSVNFPEGLTSIGEYAFFNCSSLTAVNFPEGLTSIGESAFQNCYLLTSVSLPDSLKSVEAYVFNNCYSLTSVRLPEGLTSLGKSAFSGDVKISSIKLPTTLTSVGAHAFSGWRSLNLYIPPTVKECGDHDSILRIIYPESLDADLKAKSLIPYDPAVRQYKVLDDGSVVTEDGTFLCAVPNVAGEYSIPTGVETFSADAFNWCDKITTLYIPASLKCIEADAFRYKTDTDWNGNHNYKELQFERVNFEDWNEWYSKVKLGNLYSNPYRNAPAYAGGVRITTPELKEGLTEIADYINAGLSFNDEVELPRSLKRIGAYAFYNNNNLSNVYLPDGLEEIGEFAFAGCTLLKNPKFPDSLRKIASGAYNDCSSITEIFLPEGLTELGLPGTPDDKYMYPMEKPDGVFQGCASLEKISLMCDIDYIANGLLWGCTNLNKVYFPTRLKGIGHYAFACCSAIDEVSFPSSLEWIGEYAFNGDGGLAFGQGGITKLTIPNNVKYIGGGAFASQSIQYLTLGSGLETIQAGTFGYNKLKVINFSEGLTTIEQGAFAFNYSLGSVVLPSTVTEIGSNAFQGCNISELVIPDKVTSLPYESCGHPSALTIGSGVKEMDCNAFGFDHLRMLRVKTLMPPTLNDAFSISKDQNDALTLIVNTGRSDKYTTNARWKQIDCIVEEDQTEVEIYMTGDYALAEEIRTTTGLMPSNVTKMKVEGPLTDNDLRIIGENMVSLMELDLSKVTNVTAIPDRMLANSLISRLKLPADIESIGEMAFYACPILQMSELPAGVKSIGNLAFAYSPMISVEELPVSLETIGYNAFEGCSMTSLKGGPNLNFMDVQAFSNCSLLETVDLSETKLTEVKTAAFMGCTVLDDVVLPESVSSLADNAFMGTALRDISFAENVSSIGNGAFSYCRRLVTAQVPKGVTYITDNLFAGCPRLLTLSMSENLEGVGTNVIFGNKKLANISCQAIDAPPAQTGAFDDVRVRYISLTVPKQSFRAFLNAPQWGKSQSIQNRITVNMPQDVEVSSMMESEYQDMLREDALEEATEEAAVEEATRSGNPDLRMRASARLTRTRKAREATSRYFAAVFDDAQIQTGNQGGGTRLFFNTEKGLAVTSILLDGDEMVEQMEGNTLLLPEGSSGKLEIITGPAQSGIQGVCTDKLKVRKEGNFIIVSGLAEGSPVSLYTLSGIHCNTAISDGAEVRIEAAPGNYYIVKAGKTALKVRL